MTVRIYHNPKCGTSRTVLGLLQEAGEEPEIVEYLNTPPTRDELADLIARMGIAPRDLLRRRGTPYDELELDDAKWTDDQLIQLMTETPILIQRPIVVTSQGVRLCRPAETVHEILPDAH